jgi:putative flippase GtrA
MAPRRRRDGAAPRESAIIAPMKEIPRVRAPRELPDWRKLLRSIPVSAVSFALDFFLCMILVEKAGFHYIAAMALGFAAGTLLNYFLSSILVFGGGDRAKGLELLSFFLFAGIGLLLNALFMYLLTDLGRIHYLVSRVASASLVFLFNFACRRFIVFSDADSRAARLARRLIDRMSRITRKSP